MTKPSLLYASPFPPQRSGISDYSDRLIRGLSRFFDITLLIHDCAINERKYSRFQILRYTSEVPWEMFEYKLYNIGDNPWYHCYVYEACLAHPGTVILHETVLYYLYVGYYQERVSFYRQVFEQEGPRGVAILKSWAKGVLPLLSFDRPEQLPFNAELINSGNAFVVHSRHAAKTVQSVAQGPVQVKRVWFPDNALNVAANPPGLRRRQLMGRFGIPSDAIVVGSLGFIAPTKLNHLVCKAVQRLQTRLNRPVHYLMIGEGEYANVYLGPNVHKTGFVPETEFEQYLASVDLVVNLRCPQMGEASAALIRALSSGKPAIVSNSGWFSELPDEIVVKLDDGPEPVVEEMICEVVRLYAQQTAPFLQMGQRARDFVEAECGVDRVSGQIADFVLGRQAQAGLQDALDLPSQANAQRATSQFTSNNR